jgi:hypothetical protein
MPTVEILGLFEQRARSAFISNETQRIQTGSFITAINVLPITGKQAKFHPPPVVPRRLRFAGFFLPFVVSRDKLW